MAAIPHMGASDAGFPAEVYRYPTARFGDTRHHTLFYGIALVLALVPSEGATPAAPSRAAWPSAPTRPRRGQFGRLGMGD